MPCLINTLKSHMFFTCKNFMFSDFTLKKNILLQEMVGGGGKWRPPGPHFPYSPLLWRRFNDSTRYILLFYELRWNRWKYIFTKTSLIHLQSKIIRKIFSYLTLLQTKKEMSFSGNVFKILLWWMLNFSLLLPQYFVSIFSIFTRVLTFFMFHRFTNFWQYFLIRTLHH